MPNNLALANILLLTKTMRRLDERNKSMFSDRNAVSVVVVLFRHLVIALCSILFFQDPCTSSTKRGHTEVVKCAPPRTFMFFGGQFIACAAGRAPIYTQVTPLMRW